jgi:hypothetical protein
LLTDEPKIGRRAPATPDTVSSFPHASSN